MNVKRNGITRVSIIGIVRFELIVICLLPGISRFGFASLLG